MKVAQVMTSLAPAGAERVVVDLSRELRRRGHEVTVVGLLPEPPESPIPRELREAGIEVRSLAVTKRTPWRVRRLGPILDDLDPDLVHAHLFHAHMAVRLVHPGRSWRSIETVHLADRRADRWWQFLIERWTMRRTDLVTAVSRAVQVYHAPRVGIPPERMPVVYNGVHPPPLLSEVERALLRRAWGVDGCSRVLGAVGRLDPQKGFDRLLELLREAEPDIPPGEPWGLVILGEGPERPRLERLAAGVTDRIRITLPGFRADAASCMGAFDVFLMPSRFEGFGLALVEAMAHGLPALVSPVDSLPEVAARFPAARVFDFTVATGPAFAAAVAECPAPFRSPSAPEFPFTVHAMADGYLALYERVLAQRR